MVLESNKSPSIQIWMDNYPCGDLHHYIKKNGQSRPNLDVVLAMITHTTLGLKFLHDRNYLHRDIKPQNIMRKQDGTWVLVDLGMLFPNSTLQERINSTDGTPHFQPPETDSTHTFGRDGDVYALGLTLLYSLVQFPQDVDMNNFYLYNPSTLHNKANGLLASLRREHDPTADLYQSLLDLARQMCNSVYSFSSAPLILFLLSSLRSGACVLQSTIFFRILILKS